MTNLSKLKNQWMIPLVPKLLKLILFPSNIGFMGQFAILFI